ncbi:hypothetical protein AMATHDRAFT_49386 [Amanita thiersii Skay4041]|uniref:AMP-dependent synthetase/ligase domain-containing protein n=1 Tax=Amanita thiersii Skay4041 TaxID=703135 RepID=A0A2A9NLN2_9AGAR|nr:hypothetical protein AMATHDRAFT_49386 [Amanita thiersii Skay4041]
MYLKSMFPDMPPMPPGNAHNLCLRRPEQESWPNFTVHIDPKTGNSMSFRGLLQRIEYAATALGTSVDKGGLGLSAENNDIIGIMGENSLVNVPFITTKNAAFSNSVINQDYITFVHACLSIATPFALISSYSTRLELKHTLKLSKATCLFVDEKFVPLVLSVVDEVGISSERIYVMTGHVGGKQSFSQMIEQVRMKGIENVGVKDVGEDTLAYLIFSSGTSGLPKAVMTSHGNVKFSLVQLMVIAQEVAKVHTPPPPKTPDGVARTLAFLPMHHTYGLHAYCFRAFLTPRTFVMLPRWNTELALSIIPKFSITQISFVPSIVHQVINHPKTPKTDFSSVSMIHCGAAYLPPELRERMTALVPPGTTFSEGYGMSESTVAALTYPFPGILGGRIKKMFGVTGILFPGMEARIVRDDGTEADFDEVGELWVKGANVVLGYLNNKEANKETFVDGWLHTGDGFRVDKEGYFLYDTLKVSGAQVSPLEIENVLLSHPQMLIRDVTVAGVSGGRTSDEKVPRAWVILSESGKKMGASGVVKELEKWHRENLSRYKWLRGGIEVVKECQVDFGC